MKLYPKEKSMLCNLIAFFIYPFCPKFMDLYWTTIGSTIYYPRFVSNIDAPLYDAVKEHEEMHVKQFKKYGVILMALFYIFLPLPFLFSGRWFIERGPYLNDILKGRKTIKIAVHQLWSAYGFIWPKSLMAHWFAKRVKEELNL